MPSFLQGNTGERPEGPSLTPSRERSEAPQGNNDTQRASATPPETEYHGGTTWLFPSHPKAKTDHNSNIRSSSGIEATGGNHKTPGTTTHQLSSFFHLPSRCRQNPRYSAVCAGYLLHFQRPTPTLIVGDLNAKHKAWGSHSVPRAGRLLRENPERQGYEVLGPDTTTHVATDPHHRPDVLDIVLGLKV
ncbi:hypothetical protein EVAR_23050_1 [Eumeta japonica]|uniref:Endonuclease/exonuclease/phosphatase domain-containing protein n=1 Tax=Eumeta variegata TaxID=151549 RepID=A0A4C1VPP0_EUMVA|nr:hypothetical protein EVAR_23050_1 [Eumeta japonica]